MRMAAPTGAEGRPGIKQLGYLLALIFCLALVSGCQSGSDESDSDGGDDDSGGSGETQYTLTATAGGGGSVAPASQDVTEGESASFTITPEANFDIGEVAGSCNGALDGATYTIAEVTEACRER